MTGCNVRGCQNPVSEFSDMYCRQHLENDSADERIQVLPDRENGICDVCTDHYVDEPRQAVDTVPVIDREVEVCQECLDALHCYRESDESRFELRKRMPKTWAERILSLVDTMVKR